MCVCINSRGVCSYIIRIWKSYRESLNLRSEIQHQLKFGANFSRLPFPLWASVLSLLYILLLLSLSVQFQFIPCQTFAVIRLHFNWINDRFKEEEEGGGDDNNNNNNNHDEPDNETKWKLLFLLSSLLRLVCYVTDNKSTRLAILFSLLLAMSFRLTTFIEMGPHLHIRPANIEIETRD